MVDQLNRRHLLASVTALGLVGCSSETRRTSPFWSTVTNNRPQQADDAIRAYADSLRYASMLFWFDGQSRSLVVLGGETPEARLTWYTAEKQAITTFGPFITAAIGTEIELRRTSFGDGWSSDVRSLVGKTLARETVVAHRGKEATATLRSTFRDAGATTIDVLGKPTAAQRVDETMIAQGRIRILNRYWVEPATGEWLRSHQQVIPLMAPVNTMMLKRTTA